VFSRGSKKVLFWRTVQEQWWLAPLSADDRRQVGCIIFFLTLSRRASSTASLQPWVCSTHFVTEYFFFWGVFIGAGVQDGWDVFFAMVRTPHSGLPPQGDASSILWAFFFLIAILAK
jgi:hypothetical protein